MSDFGHVMKHAGFFATGSGLTAATAVCGVGTAASRAVTGIFYLTTALTLGITRRLLSTAVLATVGLGATTAASAIGATASFEYAFSHHH